MARRSSVGALASVESDQGRERHAAEFGNSCIQVGRQNQIEPPLVVGSNRNPPSP